MKTKRKYTRRKNVAEVKKNYTTIKLEDLPPEQQPCEFTRARCATIAIFIKTWSL